MASPIGSKDINYPAHIAQEKEISKEKKKEVKGDISITSRDGPIVLDCMNVSGRTSLSSIGGGPIDVINSTLKNLNIFSIGKSTSQTSSLSGSGQTPIIAQPKPITASLPIVDKSPEVISTQVVRESTMVDKIVQEQIPSQLTSTTPTPILTRQPQVLSQQDTPESSTSTQTSSTSTSTPSQTTSIISSESSSAMPPLTAPVVGKIIRCMKCPLIGGIPVKKSGFKGGFSPSDSSEGPAGHFFTDRAGFKHSITEDGEYNIVHLGGGKLHVMRVADHVHTEAAKKLFFKQLMRPLTF